MRRSLLIVLGAVAATGVLGLATYRIASRITATHVTQPADDLDWLRLEFRLSDTELARIRALHDGYRPQCEFHCARIAEGKQALATLRASGAAPDAIAAQEQAVAAVRAECQASMLQHFEAVSREMPPDQGRHYLEEMRRITLDRHDEVEISMAGDSHDGAHGHH